MRNENVDQITALVGIDESRPITPAERILAPLELSDYSQFLYETNYGGIKGQDFTAEGIKTLGLNNGISTSDVRVEFLNPEKTEALFYCTATNRDGDTSSVVIQQNRKENGRDNPHWISKGCSRAIRNAIKARLPVQLFKMALKKAIASGEAKESAIVETQRKLAIAWAERDDKIHKSIHKKDFYKAAQVEYGDSDDWDADIWEQVLTDLTTHAEWIKSIPKGPF